MEIIRSAICLRACGKRGMRWISKLGGSRFFRATEERLIDAAAKKLSALARQSGFLSEEAHQLQKLEELSTAAVSLSEREG